MKKASIYGYMRVSSKEQNEDRQKIALMEMGVPENNIYMDKQSGKDFERTQYKRLLRKLNENSVLYIKSIVNNPEGNPSPVRRMEINVPLFRKSQFRQKRNHIFLKPYNDVMHF